MRFKFSVCLLLFIISMVFLSYIILPQNDISDIERRYLETFSRVIHPDRKLAKQADSNYIFYDRITQRLEAALEDQFPFSWKFRDDEKLHKALPSRIISIHLASKSLFWKKEAD